MIELQKPSKLPDLLKPRECSCCTEPEKPIYRIAYNNGARGDTVNIIKICKRCLQELKEQI